MKIVGYYKDSKNVRLPEELKSNSQNYLQILDDNFGADRDIIKDLGGYAVIAESIEGINRISNEIINGVVPESGSKEIIHIDETEVEAQTAAVIGWGIGAIATALLEALLLVTASVVVGGAVYYATSSIAKTLKKKQPSVHYYMAYLKAGDNVYVGPKIKSKSSAAKVLAVGQNVFAISSGYAYDACKSASPIASVSERQKHSGGGKNYYHYHPMIKAKKQSHAHCWYI